jgi:hypothetical protein
MSPFASLPVWDPSSREYPTEDAFMEAHYRRSLAMFGCDRVGAELWEAVAGIWADDAEEAADEWWMHTGRIGERQLEKGTEVMDGLREAMTGIQVTVA